ncbi:MAG: hypothetical protein R3A50_05465 [Saprospiraceae bacterium]|nr:hypothetical protein [Saprospiraceae bacterium]MCB9342378.1 hypothetical protein [Lewinellaceae bacterium]
MNNPNAIFTIIFYFEKQYLQLDCYILAFGEDFQSTSKKVELAQTN